MCLRFVFLLITRLAAWLRLSRREEAQKTAEILILCHQLAVLQRRQPRRTTVDWADRALFAALPGVIPRARRQGLWLLVTPDTILRWHRDIVRRRWAAPVDERQDRPAGDPPEHPGPGSPAGAGEPRMGIPQNPRETGRAGSKDRGAGHWGDPQNQRHRPRAVTDRAGLVAVPAFSGRGDPGAAFFIVDLLDGTQAYVLTVIEHATRRIRILGLTPHPAGEWTAQQARNLIMDLGDQAHRAKFMIRDRGPDFTATFDAVLAGAGIRTVLCNVATPRMNAITERWIGGCRRELLDRILARNQAHLRRILREYETSHNQHRPHRSLNAAAPLKPLPEPINPEHHRVRRQARIGGLTGEYRLVA
jgi:hypothetical protein